MSAQPPTPRQTWQRTLAVVFVVQVMTAVGFSSIFPFLPRYVEALGSSTGLSVELLAGLVFSGQAVTMMISSPIWGAVADRYGRKLMLLRATFGGSILLLLMAFARSAEELVLLRAIQGIVTGVLSANNALVAASTPRQHTGFAMGLLQVGLGAGLALGPLIGGLAADLFGYRPAHILTASLLLLSGLLAWWQIDESFTPINNSGPILRSFFGEWRHIITTKGLPIAFGLSFINNLGRMMLIPILPFFVAQLLAQQGSINTITGLITGVASGATTLSAVYLGRLGDKTSHRRILVISLIAACVCLMPQAFVTTAWQLLFLQLLTGVALGGVIPSISALLAIYATPGEEGAVYGLDNSINAAARAVAPLLGGGIAMWLGFGATFSAAGLVYLLAGLLALVALPPAQALINTPQASRSSD